MKVQALFKGLGKKAAPAPAKSGGKKTAPAKKAAPAKTGGRKSTGGWLGSDSQNVALDKW